MSENTYEEYLGAQTPVIILGHRGTEFLPESMKSIHRHVRDIGSIVVVDDSGDREHHEWLDEQGIPFSVVDPDGNAGYLRAMEKVFEVARYECDRTGSSYALLWEEDFMATRAFGVRDLIAVMEATPRLAQLNLPRQAVYGVEKRLGYMESHMRRGYGLTRRHTGTHAWVERRRPFTTNPGLIRRTVLDFPWPTREVADHTHGGAEPAMSRVLETSGWTFGWYGPWNTALVKHVGETMKTGTGY